MLNGKTTPQPDTVDAIIAACLDYADRHPHGVTLHRRHFRHAAKRDGAVRRTALRELEHLGAE